MPAQKHIFNSTSPSQAIEEAMPIQADNPENLNIMKEDSVSKAGWFINDKDKYEKKPLLQELEDGEDYIGSSARFNYEGHIEATR